MSSDAPPAKRPRPDSNSDEPIHSKYWFDDGNIVLAAENTLFRVHRSMLARQSEVFQNMFAMPQPAEPLDPVIEGCPFVYLSDKSVDVENLMSIFYDNCKVHNFGEPLNIDVIASMLRLGRKYQIDHLAKEAISRLHREYPNTLDEWVAVCELDIRPISQENKETLDVAVLNISREFQIDTVFAVACAEYVLWTPLDKILSDTDLPEETRSLCIKGRDKIIAYARELHVSCLPPVFLPSPNCKHRDGRCERNAIREIPKLCFLNVDDGDMGMLSSSPLSISSRDLLCANCDRLLGTHFQDERGKFWERIPSFFGFSEWSDLKDVEE